MGRVEARAGATQYLPGLLVGDRFILRRPLAGGGSGEVWVASNRSTGGPVAIKLVRAGGSALNAARFRQEATLSAALSHRNIVRVFDFFEAKDGTLGLVMECLRGETARERLERVGAFTPHAAVALVTQALAGLAHAHDHCIVHRDLKPPNLFLATDPDRSTTTKILDFGIAHTPSNTVHTLHGQLLGTPRYMSPEQIRHDRSLDGRSDVFSIAIVLYELLTGRCPFAAPFPTASLAAVLEAQVAPDDRIPPALWEVLGRALSKDRETRPASAKDFADALRAAVESNDGVLAHELHRSRPPPPLFNEQTSGVVVIQPPTSTSPPADDVSRATRMRRRASPIVLGVTAVGAAILVAAAVRGATNRAAGPPAPIVSDVQAPSTSAHAAPALPPPPLEGVAPASEAPRAVASSQPSPPPAAAGHAAVLHAHAGAGRSTHHASPPPPVTTIAREPGF